MATSKNRTPPLARRIADDLMRTARERPAETFTTIARLARSYHVAYRTMCAAVAVVRDRGLLVTRPGKGIVIGGSDPLVRRAGPTPSGAATRLADRLDDAVQRGEYRAGTPLPKSIVLSGLYHVSTITLTASLRILAERNRIHKRGKRWYIGPRSVQKIHAGGPIPAGRPVVLFLFPTLNLWYRICNANIFIAPYYNSLEHELDAFGFSRRLVLNAADGEASPVPAGQREINAMILALGKRYRGSLLYLGSHDAAYWMPWIRFFMQFDKPVVLLDPFLQRRNPNSFFPSKTSRFARVSRCHIDEQTGVSILLETAVRLGHRTIGIVRIPGAQPFLDRRITEIRTAAASCTPRPRILVEDQPENLLFSPVDVKWNTPRTLFTALENGQGSGSPAYGENGEVPRQEHLRRLLVGGSPSMRNLFRGGATAFVGCNSHLTQNTYFWLKFAGIPMPRRVSIAGLDRTRDMSAFPISSIDFGFSDLGYRTAHLFIRDIPIRHDDRLGNIASRPSFIDQGSLGQPSRAGPPLLMK